MYLDIFFPQWPVDNIYLGKILWFGRTARLLLFGGGSKWYSSCLVLHADHEPCRLQNTRLLVWTAHLKLDRVSQLSPLCHSHRGRYVPRASLFPDHITDSYFYICFCRRG